MQPLTQKYSKYVLEELSCPGTYTSLMMLTCWRTSQSNRYFSVVMAKALPVAVMTMLSGSAFGVYGDGYLRLSYANSVENLQKAIDRLRGMVQGL